MLAFLLSIITMIIALINITKGTIHILALVVSLIIIGVEVVLKARYYRKNKFKLCYFGKTHLILKIASIIICITLVSWQYLYNNRNQQIGAKKVDIKIGIKSV